MKILNAVCALFLLVLLNACLDPVGSYHSNESGEKPLIAANTLRSLDYQGPLRNPVVIIHGLLGARLVNQDSGVEVWGTFSARPFADSQLRQLAFPMARGTPLHAIHSRTVPGSLLDTVRIRLMGFPFSMHGYSSLIEMLENAGYQAESAPDSAASKNPPSLFVFYYDWRSDISENAVRLQTFIAEKRQFLQSEYKRLYGLDNYDVRFDLVAHSMGGLLARYFVRYGGRTLPADPSRLPPVTWDGAKYIDKLIQVGTPNGGYPDTFVELNSGLSLAPGAPVLPSALLGTFPSYYQMLPHPGFQTVRIRRPDGSVETADLFDPALWVRCQWGLANPKAAETLRILLPDLPDDAARRAVALDHLAKLLARAAQFSRAMSLPDPPNRPRFMQILFLGDSIPTSAGVLYDEKTGALEIDRYDAGDGKIPAVSARLDLRDPNGKNWSPFMASPISWDAVIHLRGAHMGITHSDEFSHNVRFYLLQVPTERQSQLTAPVKP